MSVSTTHDSSREESAENSVESEMEVKEENKDLTEEILNHIVHSKAIFKSQQRDEPELSDEEKRVIASDVLKKSHFLFLSRFGRFLKKEHLEHFEKVPDKNDEVSFRLNQLRRFLDESSRHVDVKNRRFEALKALIEGGEYFSETEMMRRNPLLYEQLVGKYMNQEQRKARDGIDTENITLSGVFMEMINKKNTENLKKMQQEMEDCSREEEEEDEEEEEEEEKDDEEEASDDENSSDSENKASLWGEYCEKLEPGKKKTKAKILGVSEDEKRVLKQEFVTNMYHSFLNGKDTDFDYSTVDDNEAYDNVELRTQDEEEKYFDSESPETIVEKKVESESEDELDVYMKLLKEQISTNEVTKD